LLGQIVAALFLALSVRFAFATPLVANEYGIATEFDANYGSQVYRYERGVRCAGSGPGFVFNDLWQGISSDLGWIEVGTSHCDEGDPAPKWVWARYLPDIGYYESIIQRGIRVDEGHTFKIWSHSDGNWRIIIDGSVKVSLFGYGSGYEGNSADVGLEVTDSRMGSVQMATHEDLLLAWSARATVAAWSGRDRCRDTDARIYPRWVADDEWRHALNWSTTVSAC
jgi:hypothetical protein